MTRITSPATELTATAAPFDSLGPLRLPPELRLTPEQFALVCAENREAVLELAADGRVIAMTPTGGETGSRNGELFFQLKLYAKLGRTESFRSFHWISVIRWRSCQPRCVFDLP